MDLDNSYKAFQLINQQNNQNLSVLHVLICDRVSNKNGSKKDIHYLHVFFITLIITTLLKILIGCPGQLRRADPSPGPFSRLGVKGELRNSLPNSIAHNLP